MIIINNLKKNTDGARKVIVITIGTNPQTKADRYWDHVHIIDLQERVRLRKLDRLTTLID